MLYAINLHGSWCIKQAAQDARGNWYWGNKFYRNNIPAHKVRPLDSLTDAIRENIVQTAIRAALDEIELAIAKDPTVAENCGKWRENARKLTFADVLRIAEEDARYAKL